MKKSFNLPVVLTAAAAMALATYSCNNAGNSNQQKEDSTKTEAMEMPLNGAFQNHRDSVPSKQQYDAPLFVLSHDYPTTETPVNNPSWQQALNGQPISDKNTMAYMDSLKSYVAPNLLPFFTDNKNWNAAQHGWYHEPWMGSQREAILGAYLGNGNPANMFKTLKEDEAGYAVVLYDPTAAYTVGQIWGKTGQKVNLANDASQFKEGSVIVKLAFSNVNFPQWPVLKDALTFDVYDTIPTKENPKKGYQMRKVSFFQMDIIVKDSKTSPKTGWVYSTFVYDKDAKGNFWDKMVPLGAMWGDDPNVISPIKPPYPKLSETVINPKAPFYSKETLGWGGRLSGPNDGAVAQQAVNIDSPNVVYNNLPLSSCMSCHSPSQDTFKSFLLPAPFPKNSDTAFFVYTPGSKNWNLWFRDLAPNEAFDAGQTSMDYDMVMAFKSIPAYLAAQPKPTTQNKMLRANIEATQRFRRHTTSQFWH
ncbi:hypothetical protein [Taibaiella soli]|uniref:Cytochrome c domain-containing protein n=1 Tax=Taibaiella soli TaxID=1649169 RepID=A0A2W2B275_9BACT|nr:hypothetical protein [Taibaiella soli]PZF74128.1 hypothetical protein DN068_03695 [Taibaiella soli]